MDLALQSDGLGHGGDVVPDREVLGFHERFDPWRAAVVLDVAGPGWSIPVDDGYRPLRHALRARYRDRPYTADWSRSGRFDGLVLGGAPAPWWLVACLVVACLVVALAFFGGPAAAVGGALLWGWPLARWRVALTIGKVGLAVGPPWAPLVPWHEVRRVVAASVGPRVRIRVHTDHGVGRITLAATSWRAARARLLRLGGLVAEEAAVGSLDERYRAARAAAIGLPWGVLLGTAVWGATQPSPFPVWTAGALAAAALGFVGAAVEARLDGWRSGGIFWMTMAYGVVLLSLGLALLV